MRAVVFWCRCESVLLTAAGLLTVLSWRVKSGRGKRSPSCCLPLNKLGRRSARLQCCEVASAAVLTVTWITFLQAARELELSHKRSVEALMAEGRAARLQALSELQDSAK